MKLRIIEFTFKNKYYWFMATLNPSKGRDNIDTLILEYISAQMIISNSMFIFFR